MKKILFAMIAAFTLVATNANAQRNTDRISLGVGAYFERTLDATISYEHETKYHNAWEYFANFSLKYDECQSCGHICPDSFWKNHNTIMAGIAYKPCVVRGRNHYGNIRFGASAGTDTDKFIADVHLGYEHNYVLHSGVTLFWQVKGDMQFWQPDLLKGGVTIGVKFPIN